MPWSFDVEKLTDLEVVLVWQSVVDCVDLGDSSQNGVGHLVHSSLNTGAVILGEGLHCDVPGSLPRTIEVNSLDFLQCLEELPLPASLNFCAEDAVPGLGQASVLVAVEAVEG